MTQFTRTPAGDGTDASAIVPPSAVACTSSGVADTCTPETTSAKFLTNVAVDDDGGGDGGGAGFFADAAPGTANATNKATNTERRATDLIHASR